MPLVIMFLLASSLFFGRQMFTVGRVSLPTLKEEKRGVEIYDRQGHFVTTMHSDRDVKPIPLEKMSKHMRNAVVAIEDRHFYQHEGVDIGGIVRALIKNHQAGRIVEGASTITQQLVRGLYLDPDDRSYRRKITEAIMAVNVDLNYSKPKILEAYLNEIYFGDGVYGVERAAQNYFNKHASELGVSESAFLAGLVKAPSYYSVEDHRHEARMRQHLIIDAMLESKFITAAEAEQAKATKLTFKEGPPAVPYPNYVHCVMAVLKRELGDQLWSRGWKVYTNLDQKAQALAEKTLTYGIKHAPRGINQGALVTMSVKDAALLAIVGGAGKYENIQWNRALARHTAGSSFKPFVYLAAIEKGIIHPDTMVDDSPLVIKAQGAPDWSPKNFDGRFKGWMPVRTALVQSRNVCAVRVGQEVGINNVIMTARAAGIGSQLDNFPSLALGACAVTPLEMSTAYATLARGGIYMAPQVLTKISYENGQEYKIYRSTPSANLSSESVAQLVDVMQDVVKHGTGVKARLPGIAVAGKTGTADQGKDLWFVGFTPDTVTAVWGGNDQNKPVGGGMSVTGGVVMAGIWHQFMTAYYQTHKPPVGLAFVPPSETLIAGLPKLDERPLLADQFGGLMVSEANSAGMRNVYVPAEDGQDEKRVKETGLASANELARVNALQKFRQIAVQNKNAGAVSGQSGVQEYGNGYLIQEYAVNYQRDDKPGVPGISLTDTKLPSSPQVGAQQLQAGAQAPLPGQNAAIAGARGQAAATVAKPWWNIGWPSVPTVAEQEQARQAENKARARAQAQAHAQAQVEAQAKAQAHAQAQVEAQAKAQAEAQARAQAPAPSFAQAPAPAPALGSRPSWVPPPTPSYSHYETREAVHSPYPYQTYTQQHPPVQQRPAYMAQPASPRSIAQSAPTPDDEDEEDDPPREAPGTPASDMLN